MLRFLWHFPGFYGISLQNQAAAAAISAMKPMIRTTGAAIAASPRTVTASPAKNSQPMTPIIHPSSFPTTRKNSAVSLNNAITKKTSTRMLSNIFHSFSLF